MDDQTTLRTYGNTELPEGTEERPLVTFALFSYNQENYIREAIEGAFSQTYSPLEIILSDDCSTDGTLEIMKEMAKEYKGPHLVKVRQTEKNLGIAMHFDALMRLAAGQFVVVAAGDDISHPERTPTSMLLLKEHGELGFVEVKCRNFSGDHVPDERGADSKDAVLQKYRVFSIQDVLAGNILGFTGAGRTYRRSSYVRFSPLIEGCPAEDTPALFRCLYGKSGAIVDQQLVSRRIHNNNLSSHESLSRMNMLTMTAQYRRDLREALETDLIDKETFNGLSKGIEKYAFRKQCAIDVHTGFRGRIRLRDVLRSGHFSSREKIYLFRKGMLSRVRKHA